MNYRAPFLCDKQRGHEQEIMRECETAVPNGERYNLFPLTKYIDTRGMNSKENKEKCQGISPQAFHEQSEITPLR